MSNYRIDRMDKVEMIEELADMPPESLGFDIANYKRSLFGMFSGETTEVDIEVHRSLISAMFDLFGEEIKLLSNGEESVRFRVAVQVSDLFFGWCCSFGEKVKLLGPGHVIEELKGYAETIKEQYK